MKKQICMTMAAMMVITALTGYSGGTKETVAAPTTARTATKTTRAPVAGEETETESLTGETMAAQAGGSTEILVAVAANFKSVYEDKLVPTFQEQYPGMVVKGIYDSPDKLQMQIEEELEADVLMSTMIKQMTTLGEEGVIGSDTVTNPLGNKTMLIVLTDSSTDLGEFEDAGKAESIALGDPTSVPAEQYAQETLTSLGIQDKIQDKVSFGTNVAEMLNQVTTPSADAGIIHAIDTAGMADQVQVVTEAPEGSLRGKVIYPMAAVENTAHAGETENFVEFFRANKVMKVFEEYGFTKGG